MFWVVTIGVFTGLVVSASAIGATEVEGKSPYQFIWNWICLPLAFWLTMAVQVKRWHDRDRSGWMFLVNVVPLYGWIYSLAERGITCDHAAGLEVNFRMALRAQSQCRATLETLAEIKNPRPVAFVKQANIANGPQQINNGEPSRAGEKTIQSNELLGASDGERLDAGAASTTGGANKALETLGAINRAAHAKR